jgi:ABC-type branched-subunit amino acid transport system substrate-binding protein
VRDRLSILRVLATLTVATLVVAACGDDDDDTGSPAPAAPETSTTAGGDEAAPPARGTVRVMSHLARGTGGNLAIDLQQVAQAVVDALNANGGERINGYQIEVVLCGFDVSAGGRGGPADSEECARQAVDEGVAAVVAPFDTFSANALPILEEAGIPYLGSVCVCSPIDLTSAYSFPLFGGIAVTGAGIAQAMVEDECSVASSLQLDVAAASTATRFTEAGLRTLDGAPEYVGMTPVPLELTDASAVVAAATDGVDCVNYINAVNTPLIFSAWQQLGVDATVYTVDLFQAAELEQFGAAGGPLEGTIESLYWPPAADPAWDPFYEDLELAGADFADNDRQEFTSATNGIWVAYQAFAQVLQQLDGEVTASTVFDALNSMDNLDIGHPDLLAPIDFTTEFDLPGANRLFNTNVWFATVQDGQLVSVDDARFHDVADIVRACPDCFGG